MPTFTPLSRFLADYSRLTRAQRAQFAAARRQFVDDLKTGKRFRNGLRVKRVQGTPDVWELTWAPDGRATWAYGEEIIPGEPHIIWRRVGTHAIFDQP